MNDRQLHRPSSPSIISAMVGCILLGVLVVSIFVPGFSETLPDSPAGESQPNEDLSKALGLPAEQSVRIVSQAAPFFCRYTVNEARHYRFVISNPGGISRIGNFEIANYNQRIINQTATSVELDITMSGEMETHTAYPIPPSQLSESIYPYLQPEGAIQSNDPDIAAKATQLVAGSQTEAEAFDRILVWVAGNIRYDETGSKPIDAKSVFTSRTGVCSGFSNLTVALLRAAGIPARTEQGCVYFSNDRKGGLHAWISVYYPDAGWIASDPQGDTENYVHPNHFFGGPKECAFNGTIVNRIDPPPGTEEGLAVVSSNRLAMNDLTYPSHLFAAHLRGMDGVDPQPYPQELATSSITKLVPKSDPISSIGLTIYNHSCNQALSWEVTTTTPWLSPPRLENTWFSAGTMDTATFDLDASGLDLGTYTGQFVYKDPFHPSQVVNVTLVVVDRVFTVHLPLTVR